jgi:hypothetical protein
MPRVVDAYFAGGDAMKEISEYGLADVGSADDMA